MAGSGKSVAILATLMFAMLLSGSMVNAARPIGVDGAEAAAVQPHSRQLNLFFWKHHLFYRHHHHCGWWNYWSCHPRYTVTPVTPVPAPAPEEEEEEDDKRRKLQSVNGGDAIQANGRQLNFFLFKKRKCGFFWWSKCGDDKKDDIKYDHHSRKLRIFSILAYKKCFFFGGCYQPVKVHYYEPKHYEPKHYYGKH